MSSKSTHSKQQNKIVHGGLVSSELRAFGLSRDEVIDFSVNINPLGPPPATQAALENLDISSYPDPECLELREALSECTSVSMNRIVIGNGTSELIHILVHACAGLSDNIAVFTPTFGEYETASRRSGLNLFRVAAPSHNGFAWDIDAAQRLIQTRDPDLVFLCNPNNPTGCYLSLHNVTAIAQAVGKGLLVVDDSYMAFADEPWNADQLLSYNNIVILHSMTKEYAIAGLRLGYALCPEPVARALVNNQPSWSVNAAAQAAGLAALSDREHLDKSRTLVKEGKAFLMGEFESLGLAVLPSSANFFLVCVDGAPEFRRRLLSKGMCVRDCSSFGLPDYIRIGIRTMNDCKQLVAAVKEILPQRRASVADKRYSLDKENEVHPGDCV